MRKLIFLAVILLLLAQAARAQETVFIPNCGGDNDTARIATLITRIGSNTGTIRLPYKDGTRCAVNSITFPENITLDNTDGTGLQRNAGAVVTILGPIVNPIGKPLFFGPGTTNLTGNTHIGTAGQALLSAGDGTTLWGAGGGGGGGSVLTVFGRDGAVTAQTGDYTWQQIDKAISDIGEITIRDASRLSNGITGSGPIVLQNSPTLIAPTLGAAAATTINKVTITPPSTSATLTIADGKTASFANTLAFSGTDTKSLTLTGSLAIGADTAISGGGAILLGGFTGTMPTTGTFALGANTLSVTSSNNTATSLHTHAVSSSSNPGAAASLLATNTSGFLQLTRLGIGTTPTQPLEVAGNVFINNPTANLFMRDTSTGWQASSSTVVNPLAGNSVRSVPFTSGVDGWNVTASGDAEFNNVRVRGEIAASVFKFSEITATAGTLGVFKSASTLVFDTTSPTIGGTDNFEADNSDAGGSLFQVNDRLRFKGWTGTGVADIWYTVTAVTNNGATSTYSATMEAGSAGTTLQAGMAIVDYGPSGTGFITLSADGTVGASPNLTMATHLGSPWSSFTNLLRMGNLNQSYGYATDIYGLGIGQHGVAGQTWLTIEQTNGFRIGNNVTQLAQWDTLGNITVGQVAVGASNTFISAGQFRIRNNTTTRLLLDTDGSGFLANTLISWDSNGNLTVAGNATIAGWSITSNEIKSGTGATTVALNTASTGADDIRIYAGSATAGSAPFRVTESGALTASNATISGAITATSGSFTGSITAATGTIGGWTINSDRLSSGATHIASNFDIPGGQVAWFGKQSNNLQGWYLRDAAGRSLGGLVGGASPALPFMAAHDATFYRVVIGGLDETFNGGPSVNSMGMKAWNSSGDNFLEFSDSRNWISGWDITTTGFISGSGASRVGLDTTVTGGDDVRIYAGSSTLASAPFRVTEAGAVTASNANITGAITATSGSLSNLSISGLLTMSGASSAITIGTTPPTSASAGTGIWLDRTGLYGLLSDVEQVKLDAATGAITAGAGNVTINASGIKLQEGIGNANTIKWVTTAQPNASYGSVYARKLSSTADVMHVTLQSEFSPTANDTAVTDLILDSNNSNVRDTSLWLRKYGVNHSTKPDHGYATLIASNGVTIVRGPFPYTFAEAGASAALDVQSTTGVFFPPRMTTTQRDALSPTPADGGMFYNTTTGKFQGRAAGAWVDLH